MRTGIRLARTECHRSRLHTRRTLSPSSSIFVDRDGPASPGSLQSLLSPVAELRRGRKTRLLLEIVAVAFTLGEAVAVVVDLTCRQRLAKSNHRSRC